MIHSILLIGQSNMSGRGFASEAPELSFKNIKMLRNGRWQNAFRPICPDRATAGVCLAETFARRYADEHPGVEVGIIPCSDGGTSLTQWREGGLLYDNAVYQTRLALRTSTVVAVLWHQGEADCGEELYPLYYERALAIFEALRHDLDLGDVPFILGGLGDFLKDRTESPQLANYPYVNEQIKKIAEQPYYAYADASGLGANADNLHFNAASLHELGCRYYTAFGEIEKADRVFCEKLAPNDAVRTAMEAL